DASPASRALHDRRDEGILASRVRFAIVGMCGCQSVLEVGVCQAILGMVSQVVAEAQALPERPSNLTDVDLVRAAGPQRRPPPPPRTRGRRPGCLPNGDTRCA